jgi:hypothetical protein
MSGRCAVLGVLSLLAGGAALGDDADPPGRAARVSYLEGSVSLEPAGLSEWAAAELNRPLTTGDQLWTDQGSVAELDIGAAVLRLGPTTAFSFLGLDDNSVQIQLGTGTLVVRVWDLSGDQSYEIDTPNLAVTLQQPGVYRIEAAPAGDVTVVKVTDGAALATSARDSVPVTTQQMLTFSGTEAPSYLAATLPAPDDLDEWSFTRDRQEEESPSRQYVAEDVAGADALDDNGRWQSTPDYGYVWTPVVVAAGWVPYRFGHWAWIAPWGWSWIDDAPWGYAPFHYGRWVFWHSAWCWVPGPRAVRPVYAPALVAWASGPPGRPGPGSVAWFALGPHEVYAPAYRVSGAYLRSVNLANTTVPNAGAINSVYDNRAGSVHYLNGTLAAVTAVAPSAFTSGARLTGHTVPLTAAALGGMTVSAAAPAIVPLRQSALGAGAGRRAATPPAVFTNRTVLARRTPPRPAASFDAQLAALRANGGRPLGRGELARLEPSAAAPKVRPLVAPAVARATARAAPPATPSMVERERALEASRLPPVTTSGATGPRSMSAPPWPAPRVPAQTPPRRSTAPPAPYAADAGDDPGDVHARPSPAPAYRRAPSTPIEIGPATAPRAPAPTATRSPPPRAATPPHAQAPHSGKSAVGAREDQEGRADRSRERIQR